MQGDITHSLALLNQESLTIAASRDAPLSHVRRQDLPRSQSVFTVSECVHVCGHVWPAVTFPESREIVFIPPSRSELIVDSALTRQGE